MAPSTSPKLCLPSRCVRSWDAKESEHIGDVYDIEVGQELGAGGFGIVRKASHRGTEQLRAIKSIPKNGSTSDVSARREIDILSKLHHPCICPLIQTFEDRRHFHIVLEFIDGHDLFEEISEKHVLDEERSMGIMQQVFSALAHCHQHSILHRDVKPENIMMHKNLFRSDVADTKVPIVKLVDFGLATWHNELDPETSRSCLMGCSDYLSPEARNGCAVPASDVFSAGVVLSVLLTGHLPSKDRDERRHLVEGDAWNNVSSSSKDFVYQLLKADPSERMTAEDAAAHKFSRSTALLSQLPHECKSQEKVCEALRYSYKALQASTIIAIAELLTKGWYCECNRSVEKAFMDTLLASIYSPRETIEDRSSRLFEGIWMESTEWMITLIHEGASWLDEAMNGLKQCLEAEAEKTVGGKSWRM